MDRTEEDMKFVGFFGIFGQSFKTIFKWKKIFTQITLALILPLTIIFLAHMEISHHLFYKIEDDSLPYNPDSRHTASATDWLYYWLFKMAYFTFLTVFSLLSTAAVVFTIASVYTDREVVFRQVMKVVPKVWKKLFVTFAFIYCALFIYNVITGVVTVVVRVVVRSIFGYSILGVILMFIILIVYVIGFLYLSAVWQLASVVTVLENLHGFKAMKKGKHLLNGKKKVGMGIAFVLYAVLVGLIIVYALYVEFGDSFGLAMIWRVIIGILIGVLIMILFLMFIVTQTVLYLVCKSHHREAIDKLSLSTFLGAYMGETVVYPKPGEEIQLGRTQAQAPPPSQQV